MFSVALRRGPRFINLRRFIHTPCPSCSHTLPSSLPACTQCWYISPIPSSMSYYDILGVPDKPNPFHVDLGALKKQFRNAQSLCHPDSWASKGSDKGVYANNMSASVNQAYNTLRQPLNRAEYILSRNGFEMSEHDQLQDQEFMMDIMQIREDIEEAEEATVVHDALARNNELTDQVLDELGKLISQTEWPAAKAAAIRLRYLQGVRKAGEQWLDEHT